MRLPGPVFEEITIQLDDAYASGKSFTIKANNNNNENNCYIQSAKLNGEQIERCYLQYDEIISGGILELEMGSDAVEELGVETVQ